MSRASILIVVGLLTMLVSFIGLPLAWVRVVLPVLGLFIIVVGFLMRAERITALKRDMPQPPQASPPNDLSPIS
jgi:energy-converting hydrogenase Eha subunit C